MRTWLVNPFDPLPGEREQLGRYAYLARCLRAAGHDVLWWSSAFSHRFKRYVDEAVVHKAAAEWGMQVRLISVPPYARNVSLRRLWNHRVFGRAFARLAQREQPPDLMVASSPPLEAAAAAARLGAGWRVPTVIDIQDQWPDNFARLAPRPLRPLSRLLLRPYYKLERAAYRPAAAIVGVAQGYLERGIAVGGQKRWQGVFPLGVDLDELRAAITRGAQRFAAKWRKPEGQVWLLYSGSHSYAYDFLTIVRAAIPAQKAYGDRVRFVLTGTGELAAQAHEIVRQQRLANVTLAGFLDFPEWAYLLSQADAGFNASFPDALIYLPNKVFYYLAVGAAVLNTIPGQCAELVEQSGCGVNYKAGDVQSCCAAIGRLMESAERRAAMRAAALQLAEQRFDRRIIYAEYVGFLENVARTCSDVAGS